MYRKEQKGGNPPFALLELFNDKGLELLVKLFRALLGCIRELYRLTKVEAENTENGFSVYLVLARLEVNVTVEANENINELINIIDLSEFNVKCHSDFPFFVKLPN